MRMVKVANISEKRTMYYNSFFKTVVVFDKEKDITLSYQIKKSKMDWLQSTKDIAMTIVESFKLQQENLLLDLKSIS